MRNISAAFSLLTAKSFVCLDDNVKVVVPFVKMSFSVNRFQIL